MKQKDREAHSMFLLSYPINVAVFNYIQSDHLASSLQPDR